MSKLHWFIKDFEKRCNVQKTSKEGALLYSLHHIDANTGALSQKRVERRSNIMQIGCVMVSEMDFDTLAWGKWFTRHDGTSDFYTRGVDYLSEKLGTCTKTVSRCIADMEKKGYLTSERCKAVCKKGGEIRYHSLRKLTKRFFIEMGFKNKKIEELQSWKRKKNQSSFYTKKPSTNLKNGLGRLGSLMKNFTKPLKDKVKQTVIKSIPKVKQTLSPRDANNLATKAYDIAQRTGRSVAEVYKELMPQPI